MRVLTVIISLLVGFQPAGAQITFRDAGMGSGIQTGFAATGVAAFDFSGDGLDDITIAHSDAPPALLVNNGDGTFTDRASDLGFAAVEGAFAPVWVDVNGDAHPDLFLASLDKGTNAMFVYDDGVYVDRAGEIGIDPQVSAGAATFGDFNRDGFPDLFIGVRLAADILYKNDGGIFTEITHDAGVEGPLDSVPMQATWIDYDKDGDSDLFATHDLDIESRMHVNEGALPLLDKASEMGIADVGPGNSMGIAWGDPNLDGALDAYVSRIGVGGLYMNDGTGNFLDQAEALGAAENGVSWGVVFADFDNDFDEDLFVTSTTHAPGGSTPPMLLRNDDGQFTPADGEAGLSFMSGMKGLAKGDFNGDGLVDLVMVSVRGEHTILMNETASAGNWFGVQLYGQGGPVPTGGGGEPMGNRIPVGARVDIEVGGTTMTRFVSGGDSYSSQHSAVLRFGLGGATEVDRVTVTWPEGSQTVKEAFSANQAVEISHPFFATSVDGVGEVPATIKLDGVYPNPVRSTTTISYALGKTATVRVDLFDVTGRLVFTLLEGTRPTGRHQTALDTSSIPAGVYHLRIIAGSHSVSRPLVRLH